MPRFRRGRGHFTAPTSRSGHGYVYAGRSVRLAGSNFQLTWNGPEVMSELLNAIAEGLTNLSNTALAHMQSIVPVDTGQLRDSCFVTVDVTSDGRLQVVIGAGMYYAVYVELGTSKMAARPYIRPTYDYVVSVLPNLLRDEVARRGKFR